MLIASLVAIALSYRIYILIMSLVGIFSHQKIVVEGHALNQDYIFIFPVYKEQKIITETLRYYEQFLDQSDKVQLLFVTTTKETIEPTTLTLIKNYLKDTKYKKRIKVLACPITNGTKATQLNYALDHIGKRKHESHIVMFDCDARISFQDFLRAEICMKENSLPVIYSFLPKSVCTDHQNFLVMAAGFHHAERMLAFEYVSSQLVWKYSYPMGATMIIHPRLWQHIEHIPEPIDDIPLDYLLQFKGLKAKPLPFNALVQLPPDMRNVFRQMIPIFKGVFSYFSTAKRYEIKLTITQRAQGVLVYLFYLLEPLGILLALLGNRYLLGLLLVQACLNLYWIKQVSLKSFIAHCFGYLVRLLQFFYFAIYLLKGDAKLSEFKTERR